MVLFLVPCKVLAQSALDATLPERRKVIGRVEAFGGPSLFLPNDHGLAEFLLKGSDGRTIYNSNSKKGYLLGLGLIYSINARFELQGKLSFVKTRYSEDRTYLDINGNVTSTSKTEQRNDYLVVSLAPSYFLSRKKRLYVFSGLSYAFLTRSIAHATYFSAGQSTGEAYVNTMDGFEKHVVNVLGGVGYFYPIGRRIEGSLRVQGEYGLSYTLHQNQESISINGISLQLAIRYTR